MIRTERTAPAASPALTRLASLAPLDDVALAALGHAMRNSHSIPARRELLAEGEEITAAKILLRGWAARVRLLPDGRRQILSRCCQSKANRSPHDARRSLKAAA